MTTVTRTSFRTYHFHLWEKFLLPWWWPVPLLWSSEILGDLQRRKVPQIPQHQDVLSAWDIGVWEIAHTGSNDLSLDEGRSPGGISTRLLCSAPWCVWVSPACISLHISQSEWNKITGILGTMSNNQTVKWSKDLAMHRLGMDIWEILP